MSSGTRPGQLAGFPEPSSGDPPGLGGVRSKVGLGTVLSCPMLTCQADSTQGPYHSLGVQYAHCFLTAQHLARMLDVCVFVLHQTPRGYPVVLFWCCLSRGDTGPALRGPSPVRLPPSDANCREQVTPALLCGWHHQFAGMARGQFVTRGPLGNRRGAEAMSREARCL